VADAARDHALVCEQCSAELALLGRLRSALDERVVPVDNTRVVSALIAGRARAAPVLVASTPERAGSRRRLAPIFYGLAAAAAAAFVLVSLSGGGMRGSYDAPPADVAGTFVSHPDAAAEALVPTDEAALAALLLELEQIEAVPLEAPQRRTARVGAGAVHDARGDDPAPDSVEDQS
jgi:hypothetical protein